VGPPSRESPFAADQSEDEQGKQPEQEKATTERAKKDSAWRAQRAVCVRRELHCAIDMTGEKLIREILRQADKQPYGRDAGWIVIRVAGVSDRDLSLHIAEASRRSLLKAVDVTTQTSPYDEWRVLDITATGLQFLQDTKTSKKIRLAIWAGLGVVVAFLAWLIPVLVSLLKK
jgi:hypothetical protein